MVGALFPAAFLLHYRELSEPVDIKDGMTYLWGRTPAPQFPPHGAMEIDGGGSTMIEPLGWWLGTRRESSRARQAWLDRRAEERYPLVLRPRVRFLIKPSFANHSAAVADISPHGIALVVLKPVPEGAVIAIHMPGIEPELSVIRIGIVRYVTPLLGASWLIGCQTEQDLTDTDVWQLANEQALTGLPIDASLLNQGA
jgi:hypothetical protein